MDPGTIWDVLAEAGSEKCNFIKTIRSDKVRGEMLDVYDGSFEGIPIYIKIKIISNHGSSFGPSILAVLSFKRNEFYD
jgi:hypothetical protein